MGNHYPMDAAARTKRHPALLGGRLSRLGAALHKQLPINVCWQGELMIWGFDKKNLCHFCDNPVEWHGIWIGACMPFLLWPLFLTYEVARFVLSKPDDELSKVLSTEPHYLAIGMAVRVGILCAIML